MLKRIQSRSAADRYSLCQVFFAMASLLVGIGVITPRSLQAGDSLPIRIRSSEPLDEMEESDEATEPEEEEVNKTQRVRHKQVAMSDDDDDDDEEDVSSVFAWPGHEIGMIDRASHLAGKTFGRNDSMTPLEVMPYILTDEHFIFTDVRGFVTNRSQAGGSLGVGYRRLFDNWSAWGGASAWYDADNSTSKLYQQLGLSFEGLIQQFEFRSNVYLPFTSSQAISNSNTNSQIVGNQLLYTQSTSSGAALRGVDAEMGYSLPVLDRHVVRGFVGGYHFEGATSGGVNGFKARVEGVINNTVSAQVLYTHDKLYGDNFMVGLSLQYPFASNHPTAAWQRNTPSPFRFVERNYNVIVNQSQNSSSDLVAINPATDRPYLIEQVYAPPSGPSPGGTPNGTSANPFSSVAAAQAAGGDVIYVQSGSVLSQAITLAPGQHLFGQGNFAESLATSSGGIVQIPNLLLGAQSGNNATPIIQNVTGTAITLASNTEVAGFNITGTTGNGVTGNGVSGVSLHDLIFTSIGGDAINLTNSSGSVAINNVQVASATGNGIVLDSLTGGPIALSNVSLNNTGGTGLVLNNVAAGFSADSLTVSQSGLSGAGYSAVAISGTSAATKIINGTPTTVYGTYNFTGNTKITSPNGVGFSASGTDASMNVGSLNVTSASSSPAVSLVNTTGQIAVGNLTVNTQNAMGLYVSSAAVLQVNGGSLATVNAPAVDVESSAINAAFGSVSTNGGPYGIKLESSTGSFTILGSGGYASGGTIQNTTTAGILINSFGSTNLKWVDIVNNAVGIQSSGSGQLSFTDLRISGSAGYAFDSLNDSTVALSNSVIGSNGASSGGTIRIQADTVGTFKSIIQSNTITDASGTAIQFLTQAGGTGSTLNMQVTSNTISGYNSGSSIVSTNWNGPVSATVSSNTINAYGPDMTAVFLQDPSTTAAMAVTVGSNSITFEKTAATAGTGLWIIDGTSGQSNTGTSNLNLTSNAIVFQENGGTGMRFGLFGTSADTITGNAITDQAGGGTGMLFDSIATNSNLVINANTVNLLSSDPTVHRGIIFTQVAPNVIFTTQTGSASNFVNNASSGMAFSVPSGTGVGGILINNGLITLP